MDEEYALTTKKLFINKLKENKDVEIISPDKSMTQGGLVRCLNDVKKVTRLFNENEIDCIVLGAITFGDERSVLAIIEQFSKLPIFIFTTAEPEIPDGSFFKSAATCGFLPISFGLNRRAIKFTFGGVAKPEGDKAFENEFNKFVKVVSGIKGFLNARIGMIGTRPNDFEVCAPNEALMISRYNQKIEHLSLLDLKARMESISNKDPDVLKIINDIQSNSLCDYNERGLLKVAKLEVQMMKYIKDYDLDALSIQCWTSIQEHVGVTPCLTNSRVTDLGYPISCEGDVNNLLAMLLQKNITMGRLAPMMLDMLTLHPEKEDLMMAWHCGNVPISNKDKSSTAKVMPQCPWEDVYGKEKAAASIEFIIKSGKVTVNSIVEHNGRYKILDFEGTMVKSEDNIRGAWSWMQVEDRSKIYKEMVNEGFTHHMSVIHEDISEIVEEFSKYVDIEFIRADK
jgi:L-fucose isomerase-like protein